MRDRSPFAHQLLSLLALLLFAGAGVGFSMADAVRFHGSGGELSGQPHFDQPGGCKDHAENCVLLFAGATDRAAPPGHTESRIVSPLTEAPAPAIPAAPSHAELPAPSSRAPPTILA